MLINFKSKPWVWQLTKHLRGIHNAWQFWFELALVFTAQWLRSGGLRCSPLNAALAQSSKNGDLETNGSRICKAWCA
ncbi:hypothetical protein I7096_004947 [Vibrio parahaemolyticus]|nr:hypothetical protein [Vibrio parahaemolyticus]